MKKLFSVLLIVISLFSLGFSSVYAVSAEKQSLYNALDEYRAFVSVVGRPFTYSQSSLERLNNSYDTAYEVSCNKQASDEEMKKAAEYLMFALNNMYIDSKWAEEEYKLCLEETNNGTYSEELWHSFTQELNNLKSALDDKDEKQVDIEYYKVREIYNTMCLSYSSLGDVDNDGDLTVMDATKIQKYLAGINTFSGAQLYAASINCSSNEISVEAVTMLQKKSAGYSISFTTHNSSQLDAVNLIINPYNDSIGKRIRAYRNLGA